MEKDGTRIALGIGMMPMRVAFLKAFPT